MKPLLSAALALLITMPCLAQDREERARDLGIPLDGTPGALNAITDVPGVEVGHATLIRGSGKLRVGVGPIRTGVTAVFPRGTSRPVARVCGLVQPEWKWRDDGNRVAR